ncbi:unnamed protein product [Linum trigynum]|uniref:Uncharacterized protein n=1 Tax=Linum trigynum TaxID=586398 RepID=A0AAV2DUI6_9ROSI
MAIMNIWMRVAPVARGEVCRHTRGDKIEIRTARGVLPRLDGWGEGCTGRYLDLGSDPALDLGISRPNPEALPACGTIVGPWGDHRLNQGPHSKRRPKREKAQWRLKRETGPPSGRWAGRRGGRLKTAGVRACTTDGAAFGTIIPSLTPH